MQRGEGRGHAEIAGVMSKMQRGPKFSESSESVVSVVLVGQSPFFGGHHFFAFHGALVTDRTLFQ